MIEDYNLTVLSGGYHRCDPAWNKTSTGIDHCYKVYVPISGQASLKMDTGTFELKAGQIYFISGFRLARQICPSTLDVYWLHFVPESFYLRYLLDHFPPVYAWAVRSCAWAKRCCEEIRRIFADPGTLRRDLAPAIECRIQGLLLGLISRLLEDLNPTAIRQFRPEYYRLEPAVKFINAHYRENPALHEIARQVAMAPNYFHRMFKTLFGLTPFYYMLAQRMNKARYLLAGSTLSIKEVAEMVGYENPLYFTRVFSAQLHLTPSEYRAANMWSTAVKSQPKEGGRVMKDLKRKSMPDGAAAIR